MSVFSRVFDRYVASRTMEARRQMENYSHIMDPSLSGFRIDRDKDLPF